MLEAARALGKRRGPEVEEGVELENVDGNGGGKCGETPGSVGFP